MRLLCTGDLHIGRRSSGVTGREYSCGEAWVRLARLAAGDEVDGIRIPRVDAVLVSGDLTDEHNRYYQAIGPVERGLAILADAGIPTVAVAGNHDHATLGELAQAFEGRYRFHALGLGARWEELVLDDRVRIVGWSYPRAEYPACPLRDLAIGPSELPTVGLVHVQATAGGDAYAYARPQDFLSHSEIDLWITGHIHAPSPNGEAAPRVLNPGSPQAMDPGEPGWHGAYAVEVTAKGQVGPPQPVPVSTVWYETVDVALGSDTSDADGIRQALHFVISAKREAARLHNPLCRRLSLRLDVGGRTDVSRETLAAEANALTGDTDLGFGSLEVVVERVTFNRVRPPLDLPRLATELGPAGILARALIGIDGDPAPDSEEGQLIQHLVATAQGVAGHPYFSLVREIPSLSEAQVRAAAREHGYRMLEALEAQRAAWEAGS